MKFGLILGAAALLTVSSASAAFAYTDFGAPDFPNYMSRIGAVSCDWQYPNYFRACPNPETPPKPPKTDAAKETSKKTK